MWRKTMVALACVSVISVASAANQGPYVGGNFGRDTGVMQDDENSLSSGNYKYQNHLVAYDWGMHIGDDIFLSPHVVLGTELFFDRSNSQYITEGNSANQRQFRKGSSIGLVILPGWQIDNTNRLYARLGWVQSTFAHKTNAPDLYGPAFDHVKRDGVQWGVGYEVNFAKQWTATFDYLHNDYSRINQASADGTFSYKPIFNEYNVGVNYYFEPAALIETKNSAVLQTNGWYLGGALGVMDTHLNVARTYLNDAAYSYARPYGMQGALANGHAGYRWQFTDHYVVGVEGFVQDETTKMDYQQPSYPDANYKLRENSSFGFSVLPGYKINPSNLIYARLGSIYSKFSKYGSQALGPIFSEVQTGAQMGLGYEVAVASHISIYSEYDYAIYSGIKTFDPETNSIYVYKARDNQYKLGVNYSF